MDPFADRRVVLRERRGTTASAPGRGDAPEARGGVHEARRKMTPRMMRGRIRRGEWMGTTSGLCPGYVQANLVILPAQLASAFREFCERNPGPCPLIEQTAPGASAPSSAPDADLRRDVPRYRVYRDGVLEDETCDLRSLCLRKAPRARKHDRSRTWAPQFGPPDAVGLCRLFQEPLRR